jgi:hypothetical protein
MVLLVAGCSAVQGEASPAGGSGVQLPPRPREVRVDGVDPCSLLTEAQRAELGLDARPVVDLSPSMLYPGGDVPACSIRGFQPRAVAVGLSLVTTTGIERFSGRDLDAELSPTSVSGFAAVVVRPTQFTDWCTVVVDIAAGQLLDVQFADGGREPPIPQLQLCQDAEAVADAVMQTLLSR